jgi:hypothetical protein
VAGCALLGGILLDGLAKGFELKMVMQHGWMLPDVLKYASAIILFAVIGYALFSKTKHTEESKNVPTGQM